MHTVGKKIKFYLTNTCNEKCVYCPIHRHPEQHPDSEITAGFVIRIAKIAVSIGFSAVKFSGEYGDPLVRKDVPLIVKGVAKCGADEISVATNGILLDSQLDALIAAGVNKFCISLDTLDEAKYKKITGVNQGARVIKTIRRAAGLLGRQIKINMVVLKGLNDQDVDSMRNFARAVGATLQLIELVKVKGRTKEFNEYFYSLAPLAANLKKQASSYSVYLPRASEKYLLPNGEWVEITSVRKYKNHPFGDSRIIVHPNGDVANYDVKRTGIRLSERQADAEIRAALIAASGFTVRDYGRPGVELWTPESPKVS